MRGFWLLLAASLAGLIACAPKPSPGPSAEAALAGIRDYAEEQSLSVSELWEVARAAGSRSDAGLATRAYAVAQTAVRKKWLSPEARALISEAALPALREGAVDFSRADRKRRRGADALYDIHKDMFLIGDLRFDDPDAHRVLIHELVHLARDVCGRPMRKRDSEFEAYRVEAGYELRRRRFLTEGRGGTRIAVMDLSRLVDLQKLVIYRTALENIRAGRSRLNGFPDERGFHFTGVAADGLGALEERIAAFEEEVRGTWGELSGAAGEGGDEGPWIRFDGLSRRGKAPLPKVCAKS